MGAGMGTLTTGWKSALEGWILIVCLYGPTHSSQVCNLEICLNTSNFLFFFSIKVPSLPLQES